MWMVDVSSAGVCVDTLQSFHCSSLQEQPISLSCNYEGQVR